MKTRGFTRALLTSPLWPRKKLLINDQLTTNCSNSLGRHFRKGLWEYNSKTKKVPTVHWKLSVTMHSQFVFAEEVYSNRT